MQRSQDQRINLGEMKGHIVKKIGVERSKKYFSYLSRFLAQKLSKREFDKSCFRLLGRENLSLHNQLIRSILRNATVSKSPPTVQDLAKPVQSRGDGSLVPNHNSQNGPVLSKSNGVLPISPRKVRSGMRDRKVRESNGKVEHMSPLCRENGDLSRFDHQRSGRYDERDGEFLGPSKDQVATAAVRDDDENVSLSPLVAPLGISFCSASVGGGGYRRTVPVSTVMSCCYDSGGLLPDTEMLRKRMESIAVAHGLEGVSMECANTLNTMLDVYLKKLIKSCSYRDKQDSQTRNNGLQIHTRNGPYDRTQQDHHSVSLLDFRTAMELNPQQLGENWSTLRERISLRSFEEQDLEV
ncbi:unnamed protein product [Eruca vesicaria subsp. sativa]|uniref:Transcriptional coactivator Hfi1/Transcriptional adapter 1 n=1 Tax=Eruca vesicaria subsp. sativa TaxID=29727 RepID=A0ABC8L2X2_ERUVS|nr:unnamed protein product [Eruca vesicaria subsp. sativa]